MYCIWSMILQTSRESPIPAFNCHCMYTRKRTSCEHFGENIFLLIYILSRVPWKYPSLAPVLCCLISGISVVACNNCVPSIMHPALPGALLYIQACFLVLQGEIYSTFIQFFIYLENTNVDGECRKDWQMGMILQTKLQLMGQNQHTERTKWDNVCESAYKLGHTNNCSEDRVGETSEMQMQILASMLQ